MKFGKTLRLEQALPFNTRWHDYYVNYKGLKQLIQKLLQLPSSIVAEALEEVTAADNAASNEVEQSLSTVENTTNGREEGEGGGGGGEGEREGKNEGKAHNKEGEGEGEGNGNGNQSDLVRNSSESATKGELADADTVDKDIRHLSRLGSLVNMLSLNPKEHGHHSTPSHMSEESQGEGNENGNLLKEPSAASHSRPNEQASAVALETQHIQQEIAAQQPTRDKQDGTGSTGMVSESFNLLGRPTLITAPLATNSTVLPQVQLSSSQFTFSPSSSLSHTSSSSYGRDQKSRKSALHSVARLQENGLGKGPTFKDVNLPSSTGVDDNRTVAFLRAYKREFLKVDSFVRAQLEIMRSLIITFESIVADAVDNNDADACIRAGTDGRQLWRRLTRLSHFTHLNYSGLRKIVKKFDKVRARQARRDGKTDQQSEVHQGQAQIQIQTQDQLQGQSQGQVQGQTQGQAQGQSQTQDQLQGQSQAKQGQKLQKQQRQAPSPLPLLDRADQLLAGRLLVIENCLTECKSALSDCISHSQSLQQHVINTPPRSPAPGSEGGYGDGHEREHDHEHERDHEHSGGGYVFGDTRLIHQLNLDEFPRGTKINLRLALSTNGLGYPITVPVMIARGAFDGPVLGITSALHGNELNGIPLIHRLFREISVEELAGTVVAVPVLNGPGFLRRQRAFHDGADLNRVFPGKPHGNSSQQYAYNTMDRLIKHFHYHLDLHTASFGRVNSLYVRADMNDSVTHAMAHLLQAQIIVHNTAPDGSLRSAAMAKGIPSVTIEIGNPSTFHPKYIERARAGVESIMEYLQMLEVVDVVNVVDVAEVNGEPPHQDLISTSDPSKDGIEDGGVVTRSKAYTDRRDSTHKTGGKVGGDGSAEIEDAVLCSKSFWIYSTQGGFLHVRPPVASWVREGEVIAQIRDVFGDIAATYRAPTDGIVVGKAIDPMCNTGDRILHLGVVGSTFPKKVDDGHV